EVRVDRFHTINPYHLFVSMTLTRDEVVIEGSDDGKTWQPYEFRYKPGDPNRAPPFVAPHQPRVDFQMWFLALQHGPRAVLSQGYFVRILDRIFHDPAAVAPLFAHDPFGGRSPSRLRVALYRYHFTDSATRRATGAWWKRELEWTTEGITESAFSRR